MPILKAEPESFPANLWEGDTAESAGERRWWCLHARPRQEKAIARRLRKREIAHYLPQIAQERRTPAGRKLRSVVPLFTGYLFLLSDERELVEVRAGDEVAGVLRVVDQAGLVRDLRQIHRLLSSGLYVIPEPVYSVGARIRITSGPLQGLRGTVVRRHGRRDRFVAMVDFLGRGAAVELMDWQVEADEERKVRNLDPSIAAV